MFKFLIFTFILKSIISEPNCEEGVNNCIKCNYLTKLCSKCEKDVYIPDDKGGCIGAKKCIIGRNYCDECTEEGILCKTCSEDYIPDENGGCTYTKNCEISYKGECIKCLDNFILIGQSLFHNDNFKICKSLNSEDFQNCEEINLEKGICSKCKDNFYLNTGDFRCIKTQNCSESIYETCIKCEDGFYYDRKENECKIIDNDFFHCKETINGKTCETCDKGYYLTEDRKCTIINYCSKLNENNKCEKCISNYYLSLDFYRPSCTITDNCMTGDFDTGLCLYCQDNYYIDYKDGKCKSNQEDNEYKYCRTANGDCIDCIYGYYIGEDLKCSSSLNCSESNLGKCEVCSDNFFLTKNNICSNIEHCLYSNGYSECIECEGDYYYNKTIKKCILGEYNYTNCQITNQDGKFCEKCKNGYCLNQKDHTCFSYEDLGDFYKCSLTDSSGKYCVACIDNYYLGRETYRCSIIDGCEKAETDDNRCIECNLYYCLDLKTGLCEDNDFIKDEEKKYYFRCNRTNKEGNACEICLDGFSLDEHGLCVNMEYCDEIDENNSCKKCRNDEKKYNFYCANNNFGCMETYVQYCLECNDLFDFYKCTKCQKGYKINDKNECEEVISEK